MISVIIPTLNEKGFLRRVILHTTSVADDINGLEFIVIDAGSKDLTLHEIEDLKVTIFEKPAFVFKKYASLNFGAKHSKGDIILFLDADTLLPSGFDSQIDKVLMNQNIVGGAFEFSFNEKNLKLRILTLINRIRYRFGKVYYGDQAVFVRKETLEAIGGIPKEPLMETAYLCKALRKRGKLALLKPGIATSPRRFLTHGFFKVAWFDFNMFIRFNLGLSVSGFANKYWSKNLNE